MRQKVLILVKTYPSPSTKYVETVCTAGIREDGKWVRIFPVPFRSYDEYERYSKYQWIECSLYKAEKDHRPESFHLDESVPIVLGETVPTSDQWELRRRAILDKVKVFTRKAELLAASQNNTATLAVFHPASVKLKCEPAKNEPIEPRKLAAIRAQLNQLSFFEENDWRAEFKLAEPIPYDFKYEITDADGEVFTHKIIDWELGALFLNQKKKKGLEGARLDVVDKYGNKFLDKDKIDLYLYLGTMHQFQQRRMPNPWTIIGVAPFKRVSVRQPELF